MSTKSDRESNALLIGCIVGIASPMLYAPLLKWIVPGMPWFGAASATTTALILSAVTGLWAGRMQLREWTDLFGRRTDIASDQPKQDRQSTVIAWLFVMTASAALIGLGLIWTPAMPFAVLLTVLLFVTPILLGFLRGSIEEAERATIEKHLKPVKPSARLAKIIPPAETIRVDVHRHPVYISPYVLLMLAALVAAHLIGRAVDNVVVSLAILGTATAFTSWKVLGWYRTRLVITLWRYLEISGILRTKSPGSAVKTFTDLTVYVPFWSHVLAGMRIISVPYGDLRVETPGQEQGITLVKGVPGVTPINLILVSEAFAPAQVEKVDDAEDDPIDELEHDAVEPEEPTSESAPDTWPFPPTKE